MNTPHFRPAGSGPAAFWLALFLAGASLRAAGGPAPAAALASSPPATAGQTSAVPGHVSDNAGPTPNTATIPVPQRSLAYAARHQYLSNLAKHGGIDLLFLGDSLIEQWETTGHAVWLKYYGNLKAANFGASADRVQNVLWRVQNGEGAGFAPKAIVVLAGLNNTGYERDGVTLRNTSAETAEGLVDLVAALRQRFPAAKILLLGLLPRGLPGTRPRNQVGEINRAIAKLDDGKQVFFLDVGPSLLDEKGNFLVGVMQGDRTHLTAQGYANWAEAMQAPLAKLLE